MSDYAHNKRALSTIEAASRTAATSTTTATQHNNNNRTNNTSRSQSQWYHSVRDVCEVYVRCMRKNENNKRKQNHNINIGSYLESRTTVIRHCVYFPYMCECVRVFDICSIFAGIWQYSSWSQVLPSIKPEGFQIKSDNIREFMTNISHHDQS